MGLGVRCYMSVPVQFHIEDRGKDKHKKKEEKQNDEEEVVEREEEEQEV